MQIITDIGFIDKTLHCVISALPKHDEEIISNYMLCPANNNL